MLRVSRQFQPLGCQEQASGQWDFVSEPGSEEVEAEHADKVIEVQPLRPPVLRVAFFLEWTLQTE